VRFKIRWQDDKIKFEKRVLHCPTNRTMIRAVPLTNGAGTNLDNRVGAIAVLMPQVVEAVSHKLFSTRPATIANMMTDQHVELSLDIKLERENRSELYLLDNSYILEERSAEGRRLGERDVHRDDDVAPAIALVIWVTPQGGIGDITDQKIVNHYFLSG